MSEQEGKGCGGHNNDSKSKGCGCSEHNDDSKSKGCNCSTKESSQSIMIQFNSEETVECPILSIFNINEQSYIALSHPKTNQQLLYRYDEIDKSVSLDVISGEELELVSKTFIAIMS